MIPRLLLFLAVLVGLTPWIPILYVDHLLREDRRILCQYMTTGSCYVIRISNDVESLAFYGCENGKCFRVKRGKP